MCCYHVLDSCDVRSPDVHRRPALWTLTPPVLAALSAAQDAAPSSPLTLVTADARTPLPTTMVAGREMVALDDLAALFHLAIRGEAVADAVRVSYRDRTIVLTPDQPWCRSDGRLVSLPAPLIRAGRRLLVPVEFINRAFGAAVRRADRLPQAVAAAHRRRPAGSARDRPLRTAGGRHPPRRSSTSPRPRATPSCRSRSACSCVWRPTPSTRRCRRRRPEVCWTACACSMPTRSRWDRGRGLPRIASSMPASTPASQPGPGGTALDGRRPCRPRPLRRHGRLPADPPPFFRRATAARSARS